MAEDIKLRVLGENQAGLMLKQLGTQIGDVDDRVGRITGSFDALRATAIGAFAIGGLAAFGSWMVSASKEAAEAEQNLRKVSDVITATGGAAGLTANDIAAMASKFQQSTTFSDDAVLEMSSVLLTFRNVNKDVFERAAMDILDYATIMGVEPSKAAVQFGKALNEPISGIAALQRAGVTFSESQKEMIKSFMDVNDLAGAQNIILTELEHEFGGAAVGALATFGGKVSWLGNMYRELKEAAGNVTNESTAMNTLLSILGRSIIDLTTWVSKNKAEFQELVTNGILIAINSMRALSAATGLITGVLQVLGGFIQEVWGELQILGGWAMKAGGVMASAFVGVLEPLKIVATGVDVVGSAVAQLAGGHWDSLAAKISSVQVSAQGLADSAYKMGDSWIAAGTKSSESGRAVAASIGTTASAVYDFDQKLIGVHNSIQKNVVAQGLGAESAKKLGQAHVDASGKLQGLTDKTKEGTAAKEAHKEAVDKDAFSQAEWITFIGNAELALGRQEVQTMSVEQADLNLTAAETALREAMRAGNVTKAEGKLLLKAYEDASKSAVTVEKEWKTTQEAASKALEGASKAMGTYKGSHISLSAAKADVKTWTEALTAVEALGSAGRESATVATDNLKDATDRLKTSQEEHKASMEAYAGVVDSIGAAYERASGKSIAGIDSISEALKNFGSGETTLGVLSIANAIGQTVGGTTGSVISGVATGASAGMALGAVGGIVGGVLGGISSLLSSSSAAKEQRIADRTTTYNSIASSALSGGQYSQQIMASGGYTLSGVANSTIWNPTKTAEQQGTLLNDSRGQELTDLAAAVDVLDAAMASVSSLMTPSLLTTIEDINVKFDYSVAQVGNLAQLTEAKLADLVVAVTGITADDVASTISAVFSDFEGYDTAGDAFAARMTDAVKVSVQNMAISSLVNDAIMPMLEPVLESITTRLLAGTLTSGDMSSLIAQIGTATEAISPLVTSLYNAISEAGALTSDQEGSLTATVGDLSGTATDLSSTTTDLTATVDTMTTSADALTVGVDTMTTSADALTVGVADLGTTSVDLADSAVQMAETTDRQTVLTEQLVTLVGSMVERIQALESGVQSGSDAQVAAVVAAGRDVRNIYDVLDRVTQGATAVRTTSV